MMKNKPVKSGQDDLSAPMEEDIITLLEGEAKAEIRVKGSRFIGMALYTPSMEESQALLRMLSRKYHDASHVCFACRMGAGDSSQFRMSDSGEPSGTGGKPILQAIDRYGVTDVTCVVVRYFGGVKLGTGGLARAYGECARQTLAAGRKIQKFMTVELSIVFDYAQTGRVMSVISRLGSEVISAEYGAQTNLVLRVRRSLACTLKQQLCDAVAGDISITEK